MSKSSNANGRGFEYICLMTLYQAIVLERPAEVKEDSSYNAAKNAWDELSEPVQQLLSLGAQAIVPKIFDLEPNMIEQTEDMLLLYIQKDDRGKTGDVRDIVVERSDIQWEIGFSLKHNHFAVKHNRLSPTIDWGKVWYGIPCSADYWAAVTPTFDYLKACKEKGLLFEQLTDKPETVYLPILNAFMEEIKK